MYDSLTEGSVEMEHGSLEEDEEDLRTLKVQKTSEELRCPNPSASARVRHQ